MKKVSPVFSIAVACILLAISTTAFAGNSGKIIGRASDKNSGEALVSVNILVVGTNRGAVTDIDGRYTIIGVPIGSYTVRASQVGYQSLEYTNVKVGADETTKLDFGLVSSAVEIQGVTINADQSMVNNLSTSSTHTVNAKSIENIPNVKSVEDVLRLQAGVVKKGNNIFVRGGRPNEVQYLIDGIPTNNIISNSNGALTTQGQNNELAKVYSGVQAGTIGGGQTGVSVSAGAIQSVSVQTSGFDADYGNAQSGIVNIVTKSGGDHYTSTFQFRSDKLSSLNENESYGAFSFGGPEPLTKYLFPSLGINIPGSLTFFLNADADQNDGPYTYVENAYFHPVEHRIELNGLLGGIMNGLGFQYTDKLKNNYTFNSKIKYEPSGSDQFSYSYRASLASRHDYNQVYKYFADSSLLNATLGIQHTLLWQHFFSQSSFLRVNVGRVEEQDGNDVAGLTPPQYPYYIDQTTPAPTNNGFYSIGSSQNWLKSLTNVYSIHVDYNSQVHPLHLLKVGAEFNYEEINSTEIRNPRSISDTTAVPNWNIGDFPGYGEGRWHMLNYPNRGAAYVQDNIEFSGLNIHIGLRYDYFDIGKQVYSKDFIKNWELRVNPPVSGTTDTLVPIVPQWVTNAPDGNSFKYYVLHGYFSPRLSIGYPVTDKIVFYFNYGHFLQFADRKEYFEDPSVTTNTTIGNPDLKPQRTVSYEAGFEDQFRDDMAFAVHAYYKDNFDYPQTIQRGKQGSSAPALYQNFDYASTRGFELTFNQSYSGNLSTAFSYTYQIAKGRSADPNASLFTPQFVLPRETRLNFDQNQTANLFVTYRVAANEPGHFFFIPFVNDYGISLTWNYGSGLPYTPYSSVTYGYRTVYLVNSESVPYNSTFNLSMYKTLTLTHHVNMQVTLDVTNLLNRRNVNSVVDYTGRPAQYGDYSNPSQQIYSWNGTDSRLDPNQFSDYRQFILGVRLNLE